MNPQSLLAVALGGALGSVARYAVSAVFSKWFGLAFPWGTLFINIAGSFAIGVFAESFALQFYASQAVRAFLVIGICGGFTTFSAFSLDVATLLARGEMAYAAAYIVGSTALSILALYAGLAVVRTILS